MARIEPDLCVKQMEDPSHLSHLFSELNQLRHQAAFCDVTIIVGDQRFPAHKAVLSCASDYFQGMFSSGFQESTMSEITVPGTEESFAQILDFAYTGHFTLSIRTAVGILKMASYMVLTKAIELCGEYLKDVKDKLTVEDCFETWSTASNHGSLLEVAQMYKSCVLHNFVTFVTSELFLENSSASVMLWILSDEELETDTLTEEQILQGTVMWLKYDWEHRKVHAVNLLKKIRLGLVPVDRLQEILGDGLLAIPECKNMVEEVDKLSDIMDLASPQLMKSRPDLFATRNTITATLYPNDVDFVSPSDTLLGCSTEESCYNLSKFPVFPSKFTYLESDDNLFNCFGLLVSDTGHLYAGGGREFPCMDTTPDRLRGHYNSLSENNFFRYNSKRNEWDVLPPMIKIRHGPFMIQVDECIYSFGYAENDLNTDSVHVLEKYSFPRNKWEIVRNEIGFTTNNVVEVNGNLLIKGLLSSEEWSFNEGLHIVRVVKVAVYRPAIDELVYVTSNEDVVKRSHFVEVDNMCYLITKSDQVKRVLCDLESDTPSIRIAETVEESSDTYITVMRADQAGHEFTFDKRKLGMVPDICHCESHANNKVNTDEDIDCMKYMNSGF